MFLRHDCLKRYSHPTLQMSHGAERQTHFGNSQLTLLSGLSIPKLRKEYRTVCLTRHTTAAILVAIDTSVVGEGIASQIGSGARQCPAGGNIQRSARPCWSFGRNRNPSTDKACCSQPLTTTIGFQKPKNLCESSSQIPKPTRGCGHKRRSAFCIILEPNTNTM